MEAAMKIVRRVLIVEDDPASERALLRAYVGTG